MICILELLCKFVYGATPARCVHITTFLISLQFGYRGLHPLAESFAYHKAKMIKTDFISAWIQGRHSFHDMISKVVKLRRLPDATLDEVSRGKLSRFLTIHVNYTGDVLKQVQGSSKTFNTSFAPFKFFSISNFAYVTPMSCEFLSYSFLRMLNTKWMHRAGCICFTKALFGFFFL